MVGDLDVRHQRVVVPQRTQGLGVAAGARQPAFTEFQRGLGDDRLREKLALLNRKLGRARNLHPHVDILDPRIRGRFFERERSLVRRRAVSRSGQGAKRQ